jgi:hypothetical protein
MMPSKSGDNTHQHQKAQWPFGADKIIIFR